MTKLDSRVRKNVLLLMEKRTDIFENRVAVGIKRNNDWQELTFLELGRLSRKLAGYFLDLQLKRGDKIAILSDSRPEWGVCVFASVLAGTITVPLDIKLTIYELKPILEDCAPRVLMVAKKYFETAKKLKEEIPSIEKIVLMEEDEENPDIPDIYNIESSKGHVFKHRNPSATALIIYTSGTTGVSKGVEITAANILSQLEGLEPLFKFTDKDAVLSILPMNHLFELTVGYFSFLNWGTSIYYSNSLNPRDLFKIMQEKDVSFMICVPAFLKLMKSTIESDLKKSGKLAVLGFNIAYSIARFIPFRSIKRIMFRNIHKKFGGKFKACICGGAPMDVKIAEFFKNIGVTAFQGYGMTETSPVIGTNYYGNHRLGSIGKPLPNVKVKIDENGEICVKGPNVMKGYYNRPDLTDAAFDIDGWLHTGDLGKIDKDGFLYVTGRIKNLIVLSNGKKVHPEDVETVISRSELFSEVCVIGSVKHGGEKDGKEEVCAIVVPKEGEKSKYSSQRELEDAMKAVIINITKQLAQYKRPTKIVIRNEELPKTATNKVKRKELAGMLEN